MKRLGPFHFIDRTPVERVLVPMLARSSRSVRILEIGPGTGELATHLRETFGERIEAYYAIDRDRSVRGAFTRVDTIDDIAGEIDIVIAAEMIEHIVVDDFYATIMDPLRARLSPDGTFIVSTPNPLAPGGIARDFTHLQRYPWYDLYAVFRLAFEDVRIERVHYVFSVRRLLQLLPRIILSLLLELEWCDTLVCVATKPRSTDAR